MEIDMVKENCVLLSLFSCFVLIESNPRLCLVPYAQHYIPQLTISDCAKILWAMFTDSVCLSNQVVINHFDELLSLSSPGNMTGFWVMMKRYPSGRWGENSSSTSMTCVAEIVPLFSSFYFLSQFPQTVFWRWLIQCKTNKQIITLTD